ncbi:hypothetical protein BB559_003492 [Furculomyces boomerangus]|uniref:Mitochondrial carrier protein n=2 Tax=Harpellales TaxID=61421 RepID=A0A2T9Y9E4_9FUNG|nr:hypothetical protein BB559_005293 [Furculomyces boomerangus]PVU91089.1 hypothetical protein BB559_004311 [Furculomyces boomerangus]PVU93009.1 hypothetical protein BB559_003492 [Furculomyces boomerangus]PVZ98940.1 hypothetical protein BB558_005076 [Smittium angustum]
MGKDPGVHHNNENFKRLLYENRIWMSAATAAICGVVTGYPFDSLKTRMQAYQYTSIWRCAKATITEEGFRGFYRGILPPLFTISVSKSASFTIYEATKVKVAEMYGVDSKVARPSISFITGSSFFSGGVSGIFIACLACPLELVKIQMQLSNLIYKEQLRKMESLKEEINRKTSISKSGYQARMLALKNLEQVIEKNELGNNSNKKITNLGSMRQIFRMRGIFGLYSGFNIHIVRDFSGTGIYFGAYEASKEILRRMTSSENTGPFTHMMAGGICGVLAWVIIFPIDLVKSVYQKNLLALPNVKQTYTNCLKEIYRSYGTRGFYRGIEVTLIRAFPLHALNFTVYEWMRDAITKYSKL